MIIASLKKGIKNSVSAGTIEAYMKRREERSFERENGVDDQFPMLQLRHPRLASKSSSNVHLGLRHVDTPTVVASVSVDEKRQNFKCSVGSAMRSSQDKTPKGILKKSKTISDFEKITLADRPKVEMGVRSLSFVKK